MALKFNSTEHLDQSLLTFYAKLKLAQANGVDDTIDYYAPLLDDIY